MKRFVCLLLITIISLSFPVSAREIAYPEDNEDLPLVNDYCWCPDHIDGSAPLVPGDVNRDHKITAVDALYVLRLAIGRIPPVIAEGTCRSTWVNDVNADGYCNANDALMILQYAVGKINSFERSPAKPRPFEPRPTPGFPYPQSASS